MRSHIHETEVPTTVGLQMVAAPTYCCRFSRAGAGVISGNAAPLTAPKMYRSTSTKGAISTANGYSERETKDMKSENPKGGLIAGSRPIVLIAPNTKKDHGNGGAAPLRLKPRCN